MSCARGCIAIVLAAVLLPSAPGCTDDTVGFVPGTCDANGSCELTNDCYSGCYCEHQDTVRCESECGPRGVRVQDLDEAQWRSEWVAFEDEVLDRTNAARTRGGCCGDEGCLAAAPVLVLDPALRHSARAHAWDMDQRRYFDHDTPGGLTPFDRMREAGFRGCALGENIAAGQETPERVVNAWLESPGHCSNMLSEAFQKLGVGYHPSSTQRHVWVQNFGG
jgi:uncharacterized protein YkwD